MIGKYIITDKKIPILFPPSIQHDEFKNFSPVTAGFFIFYNTKVKTFGTSTSLKLFSDPDDAKIIANHFDIYKEL